MYFALSFDNKKLLKNAKEAFYGAAVATPKTFHTVLRQAAQEMLNRKSRQYAAGMDGALSIGLGSMRERCDLILEMTLDFLLEAFRYAITSRIPRKPMDCAFWQIIDKLEICLEHLSFYQRELDPFSKYFNGDLDGVAKLEFAREFVATYTDSYLYLDDAYGYHEALKLHRLSLVDAYLFRAAVILQFGYSIVPDASIFSPMCCKRTESIINLSTAKTCGAVNFNEDFKKYVNDQNIEINTTNIINLVDVVLKDYQTQNPNWFLDAIKSDTDWKVIRNDSVKDIEYVRGIFTARLWNKDYNLPEDHSLRCCNRKMPIALCRSQYTNDLILRQDSNAQELVSRIKVNRKIRNFIRQNLNLPLIGEGKWISEIRLLRLVKECTKHEVVHQYRARWLGQQSIDIAIPKLRIAIEYNGRQHYEPVNYFGGEEAYEALVERDRRKAMICKEADWKLFVVKYDMSHEETSRKINKLLQQKTK